MLGHVGCWDATQRDKQDQSGTDKLMHVETAVHDVDKHTAACRKTEDTREAVKPPLSTADSSETRY